MVEAGVCGQIVVDTIYYGSVAVTLHGSYIGFGNDARFFENMFFYVLRGRYPTEANVSQHSLDFFMMVADLADELEFAMS